MIKSKCHLTLSWQRPLSYRNQSINLRSISMDWFLYDNGLRHERVNHVNWVLIQISCLDTGCKLKVQLTFRRRPKRLLKVLCTFKFTSCNQGEICLPSGTIKRKTNCFTLYVKGSRQHKEHNQVCMNGIQSINKFLHCWFLVCASPLPW